MRELERLPEDKVGFVLQIMQGVNGLYNDNHSKRESAFARLEQLRKKGTVVDYDAELASFTIYSAPYAFAHSICKQSSKSEKSSF